MAHPRISLRGLRRRHGNPLWLGGHAFQPVVLGLLLVRKPLAGYPSLAQPRPGEIVGLGVQRLRDLRNASQGRHGDVGFEQVVIVPARADEVVHVGPAQRRAEHPRRRAVVVLDCPRVGTESERLVGQSTAHATADLLALHGEDVVAGICHLLGELHRPSVEHSVKVPVRPFDGIGHEPVLR